MSSLKKLNISLWVGLVSAAVSGLAFADDSQNENLSSLAQQGQQQFESSRAPFPLLVLEETSTTTQGDLLNRRCEIFSDGMVEETRDFPKVSFESYRFISSPKINSASQIPGLIEAAKAELDKNPYVSKSKKVTYNWDQMKQHLIERRHEQGYRGIRHLKYSASNTDGYSRGTVRLYKSELRGSVSNLLITLINRNCGLGLK